ncbi:MAG: FAA hydrolase family protein [Alphaproteobacteria bacterium]|nr:FAA hydrolase family protein [Alphaproteobacteria bacterium]
MSEEFAFAPPLRPSVTIAGSPQRFPVRRIFCVALNYADHAREMGKEPARDAPFFFSKPADALVADGATIPYPTMTHDLHHEIELVAAVAAGGTNIPVAQARTCIFGYAVGLDLTRRDLQTAARNHGKPWDMSKGFDSSAPVGAIHPLHSCGHPERGRIALSVNGVVRQQGDLADMIHGVPEIIAVLSQYVALAAGDLIFTGTPAGVGRLNPGDRLDGEISGVGRVNLTIGN